MKIWIALFAAVAALGQNATFKANNYAANCAGSAALYRGDFDGDGKMDFALQCDTTISIYFGTGNGTLQSARAAFPIPNRPSPATGEVVIAADFNHDGKTDLGFQEITTNGILFQVLLSNGDGSFKSPVTTQVFADPRAAIGVDLAADLNGDGAADLILHAGSNTAIMIATGGGSFSAAVVLGTLAVNPVGVLDLNGDGVPDIMGVTSYGDHFYFVGKGDGTFVGANFLFSAPTTSKPNYVFDDFNGDGKKDIGVAGTTTTCATGCFFVSLNAGGGFFATPVKSAARSTPAASGDFNDDGRSDIIQNAPDVGALAVLFGNSDGSLKASGLIDVGGAGSSIFAADMNGDGRPDVVSLHQIQGQNPIISILLNTTPAAPRVKSVLNGASFLASQQVTPGALISLFGNSLSTVATAQASTVPLPTALGGTSVTVNNIPVPLIFVSPGQINAQLPWKLQPGNANVVVMVNGAPLPPFAITVAPFSPAIFALQAGAGPGIVINQDGTLAAASGSIPGIATRPSKAGEVVFILATGLGAVDLAIADGADSSDALRFTATKPRVTIGGASAQVLFSGLSPQFVGVNQLNVIVPDGLPAGNAAVQITSAGVSSSDKVTMAIANP